MINVYNFSKVYVDFRQPLAAKKYKNKNYSSVAKLFPYFLNFFQGFEKTSFFFILI